MPDYNKLRNQIEALQSHRVRVELDTGASIVGYMKPETSLPVGPVLLVSLSNVAVFDAEGKRLGERDELTFCANMMTGITKDEGPRGRELR